MVLDDHEQTEEKVIIPRWRACLSGIISKFHNRRSWVVVMFLLGTADMLMNLTNFVVLSDEGLSYGLVIGPPSRDLWISMCVFTIVGTLLYFPETVNTFSALYTTDGDTVLPIHLELGVTLLFEHIPLAIIDYFVARCRRQFTTKVASWCHSVRLAFIFLRLVWYAHIEGGKLRKNDKYQLKQVFVLLCCLLFCVTIAFNIMNWYWEPDTKVKAYHLQNVSVYLLRYPSPPEQLTFLIPLTDVLRRQSGENLDNAQLTDSLSTFFISKGNLNFNTSIISRYMCNVSEESPLECEGTKWLHFRFIYALSEWSPYGEIRYNFARVCRESSSETCVDSEVMLKNGWRLFFYEAHKVIDAITNMTVQVNVSAPFRKAYTHPMPRYSSEVPVCAHLQPDSISCIGWTTWHFIPKWMSWPSAADVCSSLCTVESNIVPVIDSLLDKLLIWLSPFLTHQATHWRDIGWKTIGLLWMCGWGTWAET